jgi:TonB family protein
MHARSACAFFLTAFILLFAPATADAQQGEEPMEACVRGLADLLRTHLTQADYPEAARKADIQGTVWFALTSNSEGLFEGSWVERSSGNELLDGAAQRAVDRIFPVGATAPQQCQLGHGFSVSLPMVFRVLPAPR